jgi:hypothetical protein
MKKKYLLFILLLSQNVFCQDYVFDKFIEYSEIGRANVVFMFNSKDSTYFFYAKNFGSDLVGSVIDDGKKMRHFYKMENYKSEIGFIYLHSTTGNQKILPESYAKNYYEVQQTATDSITTFKITRFKNDKKRAVDARSLVTAVKSESKFFPTIMEYLFNHFPCCQNVILPDNYLPTFAKIDFHPGGSISAKLMQFKNIDTRLLIEKQKIKYLKD